MVCYTATRLYCINLHTLHFDTVDKVKIWGAGVRVCCWGLKGSLERLQLDYVDVVFANKSDPRTPMEGL